MDSVQYIAGSEKVSNTPRPIFDEDVCAFLGDLSASLLGGARSRDYPDVATLAFWCRPSNIRNLKEKYSDRDERMGRGLCFHISPSNVPVNFAFSYVFSLLAGNANIVRLPSREFDQIKIICDALTGLLERYQSIRERTAIIRYPVDNEITKTFSGIADVRMIWGGDGTIAEVRSLPTKPRAVDVCFPDRYSLCVLDAKAIEALDKDRLSRLAEGFYNDTYLMDQNACSSPQIVLWTNDTPAGRERFWSALLKQVSLKYRLQDKVAVDKYTKLCEEAIEDRSIRTVSRTGNLLYRIESGSLSSDLIERRCAGGYFHEFSMSSYEDLRACVTDRFQTVTFFGVDPKELRSYVIANHFPGIDRIVPVGRALDTGVVWDGYDLVRQMSRLVSLT